MFLLAIVLQVLLIAVELFVLKAFTRFAPTQEWALWLFWNGGGAAALSTALSAHALMWAVGTSKSGNASNYANLPSSPSSASSGSLFRFPLWHSALSRMFAGLSGITLMIFSLFTIVSASVDAHRDEALVMQPLHAEIVSRGDRATIACATSDERARLAGNRTVAELQAIINKKSEVKHSDYRRAINELASATAIEAAHVACLDAREALREANADATKSLPATAILLHRIMPGSSVMDAVATYPMVQGGVTWLMLFVSSAMVHMMASTTRAPRTLPTVPMQPEPLPRTALGGLVAWLSEVSSGDGDARLQDAIVQYGLWCDGRGYPRLDDERLVTRFYRARCDELGIECRRIKNAWKHRGVALPKI
jgi:hypothetical protein